MDEFLKELPTLLITLSAFAMATVLLITKVAVFSDCVTIISPAIAFWFLRGAFKWQPLQK